MQEIKSRAREAWEAALHRELASLGGVIIGDGELRFAVVRNEDAAVALRKADELCGALRGLEELDRLAQEAANVASPEAVAMAQAAVASSEGVATLEAAAAPTEKATPKSKRKSRA